MLDTHHERFARVREALKVLLHRGRERATVACLARALLRLDGERGLSHARRARERSAGADIGVAAGLLGDKVLVVVHINAGVREGRAGKLGVKVGHRLVRVHNGLERRRDLLAVQLLPVDGLEERVLLELGRPTLRTKAVLGVTVEELRSDRGSGYNVSTTHALDKLLAIITNYMLREADLAVA